MEKDIGKIKKNDEQNKESFNRFMEVCLNNEDILSVFSKYTSKDSFFSNITNSLSFLYKLGCVNKISTSSITSILLLVD